jgi:hypothetical protein
MAIKLNRKKHPLEKKAKDGFRGYPVGTIAYYGPDNTKATKVVAAIVMTEKEEPTMLEKRFSQDNDIRRDTAILNEIKEFFVSNSVRSLVLVPKIIGCPHEEGIDYPEGEHCPECPFWRNRDRFTDEIIH